MISYKDVFVDDLYGIEDFDLLWQMINYEVVSNTIAALGAENK